MSGSLIRATPPCARMSAGTRSSAITATAPASSAIFAWSASTTSMITPPLSISAIPRFTRAVPSWGPRGRGLLGDDTVYLSRSGTGHAARSDTAEPAAVSIDRTSARRRHGCPADRRERRRAASGAASAISKYAGSGAVPASRNQRTSRRERRARVSRTASLCTRAGQHERAARRRRARRAPAPGSGARGRRPASGRPSAFSAASHGVRGRRPAAAVRAAAAAGAGARRPPPGRGRPRARRRPSRGQRVGDLQPTCAAPVAARHARPRAGGVGPPVQPVQPQARDHAEPRRRPTTAAPRHDRPAARRSARAPQRRRRRVTGCALTRPAGSTRRGSAAIAAR